MNQGDYMELINCNSPEEVYERVMEWSSDLSSHEHLVRSTILDIQAGLEGLMKNVFYQMLLNFLFQDDDDEKNKGRRDELYWGVTRMNFSSVYRILRPVFEAYPSPDLEPIPQINELRNRVAHSRDMSDIDYKGRNPFQDADCLAQVYLEAWAARGALRNFYQRMIQEPNAIAAHYARFYRENFDKLVDESSVGN